MLIRSHKLNTEAVAALMEKTLAIWGDNVFAVAKMYKPANPPWAENVALRLDAHNALKDGGLGKRPKLPSWSKAGPDAWRVAVDAIYAADPEAVVRFGASPYLRSAEDWEMWNRLGGKREAFKAWREMNA